MIQALPMTWWYEIVYSYFLYFVFLFELVRLEQISFDSINTITTRA